MSRASGLSRIRILWPDRSVAAYINPCKLSTHSKLALKVAEVFGKDDIILDENGCSEDLKRKIDEVVGVPGGLDKLKGPDGDAFKAQIVYAATLARTKATCAKSGAFKEFVSATLNKLYSDASEALAGAKDFVTCDDIKVPVARLAALQQRTEEQLRRLDGRVAALEDGAKQTNARIDRLHDLHEQQAASHEAQFKRLGARVESLSAQVDGTDMALTASARSTKHTADAAAAIKEALDSTKSQLEDSIKRGAEQKALLAELKKQQADYEAREVARAHEQTVADAERDMMLAKLAEHEQLLVDHSSALADITSMKTHDTLQALKDAAARLGLGLKDLSDDVATLTQSVNFLQWQLTAAEDGGLQSFASTAEFVALKEKVADLAAAKLAETSLAGGAAASDDPIDSFLAKAGNFLAAAERQWAEPPPLSPFPAPLPVPLEGQEQLEVTTPPHPATLPPPIGLTVRPPPVEAGGQVDASPLPLSPPSNKKRGVLGQLSANLSRVFSPRRKPATPATPATPESDLAFYGFE